MAWSDEDHNKETCCGQTRIMTDSKTSDLQTIMERPDPFELDLPWGDYEFSRRFFDVVHDWGIPTEKEVSLIRDYVPSESATLFDMACGGGRHALALASEGYAVTAMEIGRYPIELARRRAAEIKVEVDLIEGDIRGIEYRDRFDLAYLICGQLGHLSPSDSREVFIRTGRALKAGGYFMVHLFSFDSQQRADYTNWYKEKRPFYFSHPAIVHREHYYLPTQRVRVIRDFAIDSVTRENRLFGISEKNYSQVELEALASVAGLTLTDTFGSFDKVPLTEDSPDNIYIFRKP